MRILLFDYLAGGHHSVYLRQFVEILRGHATVTVAAPAGNRRALAGLPVEFIEVGAGDPPVDTSHQLSRATRNRAERELRALRSAIDEVQPDHAIHVFADGVLRWLAVGPALAAPLTVLLFRPRAHYPSVYGMGLSFKERAEAQALECILRVWRLRGGAQAVLTLDEVAATRWSRGKGAPAFWLPEPPPAALPAGPDPQRSGCALYGSLTARKGVHLLGRAVALQPTDMKVVLAGAVKDDYRGDLAKWANVMRSAGARVDVRDRWHSDQDGLNVLREARCAVLPYIGHYGMSRVLLEAAVAGTPVIVPYSGLLSHLVREHRLGVVVDCEDPAALRAAIDHLIGDPRVSDAYRPALAAFAARYSVSALRQAVFGALNMRPASEGEVRTSGG